MFLVGCWLYFLVQTLLTVLCSVLGLLRLVYTSTVQTQYKSYSYAIERNIFYGYVVYLHVVYIYIYVYLCHYVSMQNYVIYSEYVVTTSVLFIRHCTYFSSASQRLCFSWSLRTMTGKSQG